MYMNLNFTYSSIHVETRTGVSTGIHGNSCSVRYKSVIHSTSCSAFTVHFRYINGTDVRVRKDTFVASETSSGK